VTVTTGLRNAGYGLLTLSALLVLVVLPWPISMLLPTEGAELRGQRIDIGYGASVAPPPGSRHDLTSSRPGSGDVLLRTADGLDFRLVAREFRGAAGAYLEHARHKLSRDDLLDPIGPPEPVRTASGLTGEQGSLTDPMGSTTPTPQACYTILTGAGVGVTALVTGVAGCEGLPEALRASIAGIAIDRAGAA
jgi:hypothetical protein